MSPPIVADVKNGVPNAMYHDVDPMLVAKVDESVRQLIGRRDNGVKSDKDAFGNALSRSGTFDFRQLSTRRNRKNCLRVEEYHSNEAFFTS